MAVRANKPAFNIREKLKELTSKFGLKGHELMSAATLQDARDLVSAGRKNLVINGDMRIDQRAFGTVSGSGVYGVDRFKVDFSGGSNTTQQYALSSTDGPGTEKFNYALRCTSGGDLTTSSSYVQLTYKIEHTDIFNSGWNYNRSGTTNNYLTVSFWVRSSVSTDFNWMFLCHKATAQVFRPEPTKLTAGVWKKVVAKIPPNSSINFDNTTDLGASIYLFPHVGSTYTSTPTNPNGWETWSGSKYGITNGTWGGSSGATFDLTGVQIEVSDNATEFERRTIGEELALCQRYYYRHATGTTGAGGAQPICNALYYSAANAFGVVTFPTTMRDIPDLDQNSAVTGFQILRAGGNEDIVTFNVQERSNAAFTIECSGLSGTIGHAAWFRTTSDSVASVPYLGFNADF
jgi:hypothetical protein